MPDTNEKPALVLVDGSNYVYRAYYAIRELSNSKGFPTNAIYGFTTMLVKLLRDMKPQYIAVAFDLKGPTFRHDAYEDYKATRKATPDTLIPQIPYIKDIVRGFSIPILEQQGIEADDIIGTLAKTYADRGIKIVIVSGDKDLMQLITDDIVMVDTMKEKTYDREAVKARFGVGPEKVVDILGLMGDASDNIPGVPGIGPKTAQRLIQECGTIEEVLKNTGTIRNAKVREAVEQFAEQARMSRDLATIKTDVEIDFDLEAARYTEPDREALKTLFKEFEFSSLLQELKIREEAVTGNYQLVLDGDDFTELAARLAVSEGFALDVLMTGPEAMRSVILGLAVCPQQGEVFYIPLGHDYPGGPAQLSETAVLNGFTPLFADETIKKHGHDLKNALILCAKKGVALKGIACDTMVASYILSPAGHSFELPDLVREHLSRQILALKELAGSGAKAVPLSAVSVEKTREYACQRADAVRGLSPVLAGKIDHDGFHDLFHLVEMPLISVLAAMERNGVLLDVKLLGDMSKEMAQLMSLAEEKIYRLAGEKFNVNSPKQLQTILFDKLGLPKGKKTKEGYSTDVEVLAGLARSHALPAEILAYRSLAKLKSTYIDALPLLVNPETGRVHTSYNQTGTATGRLSSSNPNLQNIPIRTVEGKRIRQAFIAPPGWEIVSADYSQIELRVLAHLSGDETLVAAFASGEDIHTRTAADVFGVFPEMVNPDMRRQAKVINFGVLYGMSAFGLAKELGIAQKLAQAYIDEYFHKYRGVRIYLDGILEKARRDGFVTTILNRRRYLPELNNGNVSVRQFAERMAINAPIQGSAADLIKVAMINISSLFAKKRLQAAMIMQVHDELVFEAPAAEKEEVMAIVCREMEQVVSLNVPLKVDCASGKNWDEAHT
ncbi:MAG: DNA polymerase I [Deltaproteobacteria bacterium]|nr:DNA polymerase I [Deltaproteobacteria bacterium]